MVEGKPLSKQEERFCQEYTLDYNQTQAAIRAGYKESNAAKQGCKLMKDPRIQARIREIQEELKERLFINRTRIVLELMEVAAICKAAVPVMEWNYQTHQMEETGQYQIDARGAVKALDAVGKYLGLDKQEPTTDAGPVFYTGEGELKE